MKSMSFLLFVSLFALDSFAQGSPNPFPRTITVNGSAEMEIVPDEIYVQVYLKEYDKKAGGKVTIDKIRQDFLTAVRSLGLPDTTISVSGYDANSYNPWWRKKARRQELHAAITYQVKLNNTAQVDQLVDKLDDNATQNFYISRMTHSRLDEFKRALKIQAVKAAKEKAQYLSDAIGEKVGGAVTISEPGEYYQPYHGAVGAVSAPPPQEVRVQSTSADQPQADFRKLKIRYEVTAVFALI
jgi:uncharacterized protein YggE